MSRAGRGKCIKKNRSVINYGNYEIKITGESFGAVHFVFGVFHVSVTFDEIDDWLGK
jgi:hypothetical protein